MHKFLPILLVLAILGGVVYFGFVKDKVAKAPASTVNTEDLARQSGLATEYTEAPPATGNIDDALEAIVAGSINEQAAVTGGDGDVVNLYQSGDSDINEYLGSYDESGI